MKSGWYNTNIFKALTHAAVWAIVLSLPYLLDTHHGMEHRHNDRIDQGFFYLNLVTSILWIGPFYLNAYLLTPRLFNRRHYLEYAAAMVLLFGLMLSIHFLLFKFGFGLPHFNVKGAIGFLLPAFLLTIAVSIAFRLVSDRLEADKLAKDRQEENLKTELSFLRSQISPHFIFNILNNLVALEQMKSPELGPTILKLSALMQYMLYEADEERVLLSKEVDYLQSYIDLQKQRFGNKVPVTVSLDAQPGFLEIEPMLLIPFVENAFKHGVGLIEQPAIAIDLKVHDKILYFEVRNRYNEASSEVKDKTSGIGLGNVQRRLKLLYGNQQHLDIIRGHGWFTVALTLNLH
ncbi:MAG TPA: histidine kinase [Puia sp.]|jgi:sensor histidine kinase YesM|nr:histidine kinase [Puia sp.]